MAELTRHQTPSEQMETVKDATVNFLPDASREKYNSTYNKFMAWREEKNMTSFSENVMMAYFSYLASFLKPSSLWANYSMIKKTLNNYHNIDIQSYTKLLTFLKKKNVGFKSKKSKVFTVEDITKFLNDAPDREFLAIKVGLIFGINGACRRDELCNVHVNDVKEYENSMILIKLPRTKGQIERSFTITDKFYNVVKQYMTLRPKNTNCDRFFLSYRNGKCIQQPIGINKFGNMAKVIATYLGLPEPELYTGHSFRRTSATLLADAGSDRKLKRHRGRRSIQVTEGYVEDSTVPSASSEGASNAEERPISPYEHSSHLQIRERATILNDEGDKENSANTLHEDLTCDICKGPIQGFRYKCVQCVDFDLCAKCEAKSEHPLHFMLRIPRPMSYATVQRVLGPLQNLFVPIKEEPKEFDVTSIEGSFKESPKRYEHEIEIEFPIKPLEDPLELSPVQAMKQVKKMTGNDNSKKTQVSKWGAKESCTNESLNENDMKEKSVNSEKCFVNVKEEFIESPPPYKIEPECNKRRRISEDSSDTDKRYLYNSELCTKKEYIIDEDPFDDEPE